MGTLPGWPTDLRADRLTPIFTETSVPAGLLRDHATRAGVWARLHVLSGSLRFTDQESGESADLLPGCHELIFPGRLHHVALLGPVRFQLEFCRRLTEPGPPAGGADRDGFPHEDREQSRGA